jgi:diguanylate cyclase (GGDEF)-like protein
MRQWLESLRIQKKLWLFHLVTALTSGIVAAVIMILTVWNIEKSKAEYNIGIKAAIVADNILPSLQFRDTRTANDILKGLARDKDILSARVTETDGTIFATFTPQNHNIKARLARPNLIRISAPLIQDNEHVGTVELVSDMNSVYRETAIYTLAVAIAMLTSLLVGSLLMGRLNRAISLPLIRLAELMKQVSEHNNYSHRTHANTQDEVGELGRSFNHMIEQIQQRDSALSHELVERKRAEDQLEYLAHHDPVTNLHNRHFFRSNAVNLMRPDGALDHAMALLFIDLDNFKYVNDTFGHDCGDQLLSAVAARLQAAIRGNDMVVRFGGDEFVVLLQGLRETQIALNIAEKLRETITKPLDLNGQEFVVTCSIGIAVAPLHGNTAAAAECRCRHVSRQRRRQEQRSAVGYQHVRPVNRSLLDGDGFTSCH